MAPVPTTPPDSNAMMALFLRWSPPLAAVMLAVATIQVILGIIEPSGVSIVTGTVIAISSLVSLVLTLRHKRQLREQCVTAPAGPAHSPPRSPGELRPPNP